MALNKDLDSYERGFKPFVREGLSETFKNLRFWQKLAPEGDTSARAKVSHSVAAFQTLCMAGMVGTMVQFGFDIKDGYATSEEIDITRVMAPEDVNANGGIVATENLVALHQDGQYYVFSRPNGEGQFTLTSDPEEALLQIDRELSVLSSLMTMNEIEANYDFDVAGNEHSFAVTYDEITQPYQFVFEGDESDYIHVRLTGMEHSPSIMDADMLMQQSSEWNTVRDHIAAEGYTAETIAHLDLEHPAMGQDAMLEDAAKTIGGFTFLSLILGFGLAGLRQSGAIAPPKPTPTHKKFRRKDNAHVGKSHDTGEPGPL